MKLIAKYEKKLRLVSDEEKHTETKEKKIEKD